MTSLQDECVAVTARARRQFPDYSVEVAFPVCLPVYELQLTVTVMDEHKVSTTALFVLRLLSAGVSQPSIFGRLLGIPSSYVSGAAAELLSASLIRQRNDRGIEITEQGEKVLSNSGKSTRPRNRSIRVPYDHLTKSVISIDVERLLDRDAVQRAGSFIVPARPRKPRLGNISISEVKDFARERILSRETDVFDITALKDARLRYRDDVILVKLVAPNVNAPIFAAYRAQQYLEEETASIQRLAEGGIDLVPEEWKLGFDTSPSNPLTASGEEISLLLDIVGIHRESRKKTDAAAEARATLNDTKEAREQSVLVNRVERLETENLSLQNKLADREAKLKEHTNGACRLIRTEEHRPLLLQAIDDSSLELTLVSAWINPYAFDDEVSRRLVAAIGRGVTVRIAWGMGVRHPDGPRQQATGNRVISEFKRLVPEILRHSLTVKFATTHEKFIICDDRFCAWGSFNWLSYRGEPDDAYRRETSYYSERQEDIALWKENSTKLF